MISRKSTIVGLLIVLTIGIAFRLFVATRLATDEPDDGRLYSRIAMNVIEQHSYSIEQEPPFSPTLIRVPGYPLFVASCYRLFGRENNRAVRIVQALLDTGTCLMVGLLAWAWAPRRWSHSARRLALLSGTALGVICPFTAIYVGTILTETWTTMLVTTCVLLSSLAILAINVRWKLILWTSAGLIGGIATMFRPDAGLFVAAVGLALIVNRFAGLVTSRGSDRATARRDALGKGVLEAALLCGGFLLALAPWTIRNARLFQVFQPIAPTGANMPGEFVPRGYARWLKTWVVDDRYIAPLDWALDLRTMHVEQAPDYAFDSTEERERVARLYDLYNGPGPADQATANKPNEAVGEETVPGDEHDQSQPEDETNEGDTEEPESADDQSEEQQTTEEAEPESWQPAGMTPEIDAQFDALAKERINRHPFKYYAVLPARRAASMWFDTHSQYYPFQGWLFPLTSLDRDLHQQIWLPLFAAGVCVLTLFAAAGAFALLRAAGRRLWIVMFIALVLPRVAFLSTLENPEPRYVVEFFPFVMALAALGVSFLVSLRFRLVTTPVGVLLHPSKRHS